VFRTLNDHNSETYHPVALVNWTNEEGVRFEPAMTCSAVAAGRMTPEYVYERKDRAGTRFADALAGIGYLGDAANRPLPAHAYLELHIEQGPVLESRQIPVAAVGGIVGITWNDVKLTGQADHAGPSPMPLRHDALTAAAEIILGVEQIALNRDDTAVATVGRITASPNIINTIPGTVQFSVDFRHRDPNILDEQVSALNHLVDATSNRRGVRATVERFWTSEPTPFDRSLLESIGEALDILGITRTDIWSGAGHDAKYVADVCPSAMIFVRSQAGLSHCEQEFSTPDDVALGVEVLFRTACNLAGRPNS
jgi:N-carbamoyl-L-amino-acid hydrolase